MEQTLIVTLFYNMDTGHCFVETSLANRKTETNPIGCFVRFFDSLAEALQVKSLIDKRPYLAQRYLNIP